MCCTVKPLSILVVLSCACLLLCHHSQGLREFCEKELTAHDFARVYESPNLNNILGTQCTLRFHAKNNKATITLEGVDVDLSGGARCSNSISIYDGRTTIYPLLKKVCGKDRLWVRSSGPDLMLVYAANFYSHPVRIRYFAVYPGDDDDHGGYDADFSTGLSSEAIVGICVAPTICVLIITLVTCRAVKSCHKLRDDLAARGYTTHDLRLTQMTMNYKAVHGQLTTHATTWRGRPTTRNVTVVEVRRAIQVWCNRGFVADPADSLQAVVQEHMDQFASQRQRGHLPQNLNRVRHPAGDIHANQATTPQNTASLLEEYGLDEHHPASSSVSPNVPFLSVDTSGDDRRPPSPRHQQHHHHHHHNDDRYHSPLPSPYTEITGSNNNLATPNNNSAPNLNLLPSGGQNGNQQLGPTHPPHHHHHHHRHHSPSNSLGRRSPRHDNAASASAPPHQQQNEGSSSNLLTCYGMVGGRGDGQGGASPSSAPPNSSEGQQGSLEEPPPSYEEATAGGKLSPYNSSSQL